MTTSKQKVVKSFQTVVKYKDLDVITVDNKSHVVITIGDYIVKKKKIEE